MYSSSLRASLYTVNQGAVRLSFEDIEGILLLIMSFEEFAKRGICGARSCIADRELEREMNHFEISWREEKGKYDKSGTKESERGECDLTRGDLLAKLSKDPREVQGEGSRRCQGMQVGRKRDLAPFARGVYPHPRIHHSALARVH